MTGVHVAPPIPLKFNVDTGLWKRRVRGVRRAEEILPVAELTFSHNIELEGARGCKIPGAVFFWCRLRRADVLFRAGKISSVTCRKMHVLNGNVRSGIGSKAEIAVAAK